MRRAKTGNMNKGESKKQNKLSIMGIERVNEMVDEEDSDDEYDLPKSS